MSNVEIKLNNGKHACTGHIITCDDTGRTIASFQHESDIQSAAEAINNYSEMKKLLSSAWDSIQEAGYEDHCIVLGARIESILHAINGLPGEVNFYLESATKQL